LAANGLYPILDAELAEARGHDLVACARAFARLGIPLQQLRAKTLPARDFLKLAQRLAEVVPTLIVNDRLDIARLAGAAGVHLGQDDLPLGAARPLLPPGFLVGLSTHTLDQARAALALAPNYFALGPVFPTTSKMKPDAVVGVQALGEIRWKCPGTLVAIGGITRENAPLVWRAGANAVAVISALWCTPDPVRAAEEFLLAFARVSCHSPGD